MRTFASQGLTPQIVISYPISSHLHHICASSYLRFLSQISTSSLSSSGLHILRPHLVFTRSDLHRRVTLSLSYHLQDFIMQLLSQLYNLIYLRLQNFISPRSRANRRLVGCLLLVFIFSVGRVGQSASAMASRRCAGPGSNVSATILLLREPSLCGTLPGLRLSQ